MEPELYEAAEVGNINPFKDLPTLNELLTPKKKHNSSCLLRKPT